MRQRKDWRRTIRQHDFAQEDFEIDAVIVEVAHIAFAGITQRTLREPLSAPVERGHRKAARAQIAHGLEIFFDEFGTPLEQAHGTLASSRWRPACITQGHAIGRLQGPADHVLGHRIGRDGDERHGLSASGARPSRLIAVRPTGSIRQKDFSGPRPLFSDGFRFFATFPGRKRGNPA